MLPCHLLQLTLVLQNLVDELRNEKAALEESHSHQIQSIEQEVLLVDTIEVIVNVINFLRFPFARIVRICMMNVV
jgi:hypothetical protein